MEQVINILIFLGGVGFFIFMLMHGRKEKKENDFFDTYKPLKDPIKAPDLDKISEGVENETPQESVDHTNDLLNDLFGD